MSALPYREVEPNDRLRPKSDSSPPFGLLHFDAGLVVDEDGGFDVDQRSQDLARRISLLRDRSEVDRQPVSRTVPQSYPQSSTLPILDSEKVDRFAEQDLGNPRGLLYCPKRRNIIEFVLPPTVLIAAIYVMMTGSAKRWLGVDHVSVDLLSAGAFLAISWRAVVRLVTERPLVRLSGDHLYLYGPFRRRAITLAELSQISFERDIPLWVRLTANPRPRYRLQMTFARKRPFVFALSPGQVVGGLFALREFADVVIGRLHDLGIKQPDGDVCIP